MYNKIGYSVNKDLTSRNFKLVTLNFLISALKSSWRKKVAEGLI